MSDHARVEQPAEQPPTIPLTTELSGWLAAYQRAKAKVRQWSDTRDQAQKHITDALDAVGATVGTVDGQPAARWTTVHSRRVDGARLRADHPDLAEAYSTTVVSRKFTTPQRRADQAGDQPNGQSEVQP
ncbi:MAG TPA: hypothetical protein VFW65_31895 [Pseudonocardiaceae bacterium]|nr:hypothetical protein [Pseudonocardiaceae bacterium]